MPSKERIKVQIIDTSVLHPIVHKDSQSRTVLVYPSECRMRGTTYKGKLQIFINWSINGKMQEIIDEVFGEIPIMVKSNRCNLQKLNMKQLVDHKEDAEEFGGYWIINGNEKVVRLLTAQRRNYPLALSRKSWKDSGHLFSNYGISIRCVRNDQMGAVSVAYSCRKLLSLGVGFLLSTYARA